jgi:hypothetical protein
VILGFAFEKVYQNILFTVCNDLLYVAQAVEKYAKDSRKTGHIATESQTGRPLTGSNVEARK